MTAQVRKAGPFVNDGERRVVDDLRRRLQPNAIIISNLYLPIRGDTLEVDAVVLTAFGAAVVEVKDWLGEVRFERDRCVCHDGSRPDPRPSISRKAKVLASALERLSPARDTKIATSPLVVFARDETRITGDLAESVPVVTVSTAASLIAEGRLKRMSSAVLSDKDIKAAADALWGSHDPRHERRVGPYLLGEPIEDSPFEEYRATEAEHREHRVRLKRFVVDDFADPVERQRQQHLAHREVEALRKLAQLRHRALPLVYSNFADPDDDATIWTAYEAVEGPDLSHPSLSARDRCRALADVADALEHCHREGVLHRALTPRCVLAPQKDGHPRLLHFDFARVRGCPTVAAGALPTTLREAVHVAPEVRRTPAAASPASDVYSLAAVAAEVLTGAGIATQDDLKSAVRKVKPRALSQVLHRAIETDVSSRAKMAGLADAFRVAAR